MKKNTDWMEVAKAGVSTTNYNISSRDQALVSILQRFQTPVTNLFQRQFRKRGYGDQNYAQDMFAQFCVYVLENRKKIFRSADPEKGKLRSFVFTIAARYFQRKVKDVVHKTVFIDPKTIESSFSQDNVELDFEIDYVQELINLSLNRLKQKDKTKDKIMFHMFKYKFFAKQNKKITAFDLAKIFGESCDDDKEKKKAEDRIYQRLKTAKKLFAEILLDEIRETLMIPENTPIPQDEKEIFCKYIRWIHIEDVAENNLSNFT